MKRAAQPSEADDHRDKQKLEIGPGDKPEWETPQLEEVSSQVMAQPYIRFT